MNTQLNFRKADKVDMQSMYWWTNLVGKESIQLLMNDNHPPQYVYLKSVTKGQIRNYCGKRHIFACGIGLETGFGINVISNIFIDQSPISHTPPSPSSADLSSTLVKRYFQTPKLAAAVGWTDTKLQVPPIPQPHPCSIPSVLLHHVLLSLSLTSMYLRGVSKS